VRLTRLHLAIVLTGLGALGALWAVNAQEIFPPPLVLQLDPPPPAKPPEQKVPAAAKYPLLQTQPLRDKSKPDPTLIIPPEAYDIPHPVQAPPLNGAPGLLLTEGVALPAPVVLPAPPAVQPIPPPTSLPAQEPKPIVLPVIPTPLPEPTKMLIEPLTKDPPAPNNASGAPPPSVVFPSPLNNVPAPTAEKPKAFVRLRSAANDVAPPPIDLLPGPPGIGPLVPPPGLYLPKTSALLNLQTPAIGVEKRGPATLRAGETQTYQIVIRNLGVVPAQQVRIDEDIPPGARFVSADPQPQWQGTRATWILSAFPPGSEQMLRLTLQADVAMQLGVTTSAHVSAMMPISTTAMRPPNPPSPLAVRLSGPERASVGKPVAFDVQVTNQSGLPLTGVVLFGYLPEGLIAPGLLDEHSRPVHEIEGEVAGVIAPGGVKMLKMPAKVVKPGRYTVVVKLKSSVGEASATTTIDIAAEALTVQQAELTRLFLGRDGDLHIDVANGTGKPLHHVQVACVLPEGLDYLGSSDRGMYQGNRRSIYWLIDAMPAGQTTTLAVRVAGTKAGQFQNLVSARADGIAEIRSTGTIALEGITSLKLRVIDRDNPLELGKDTVYEIQIQQRRGGGSQRAPAGAVSAGPDAAQRRGQDALCCRSPDPDL
jgi:uncharacterized repeat protein (TIGR01451 family)